MSYQYRFIDLLNLLYPDSPKAVDDLMVHRGRVVCGLLSVGLKLHFLEQVAELETLVDLLGGRHDVLEVNRYKRTKTATCFVLPPVGSADAAITLITCLERTLKYPLFNNPKVQVQVCSPGRFIPTRAALLAIGFYLGSDVLQRYSIDDLETTFSEDTLYARGKRLVLYDAPNWGQNFDPRFDWWESISGALHIRPMLPFNGERTDMLTATSALDVQNINLIATLLAHLQYSGYWGNLGSRYEQEMRDLLARHMLLGLLDAPWIRTEEPSTKDDRLFFAALQELTAYAYQEEARIKRPLPDLIGMPREHEEVIPARPNGILLEISALLEDIREDMRIAFDQMRGEI